MGLFSTQLVVTLSQFTILRSRTHTSFHTHVISSRCSVAAFNSEPFPSSMFPISPEPQLPASHNSWPLAIIWLSTSPAYAISARTAQKTPLLIAVVQLLPWENVFLRVRYSESGVVYLLLSRPLPSNASKCLVFWAAWLWVCNCWRCNRCIRMSEVSWFCHVFIVNRKTGSKTIPFIDLPKSAFVLL